MKPLVHYLSLTCIQRCEEKLMMYIQFCESNMEFYINVIYQSSHGNQLFDATLFKDIMNVTEKLQFIDPTF